MFSKVIPSVNKVWEQLNENPEFQKYKHKKTEAFELLMQRAKDRLREFILNYLS